MSNNTLQDFARNLNLNAGMSQSEMATEVVKALGFGAVTTDQSLLTQGGALTLPTLDEVIVTMRIEKKDFVRYHSVKATPMDAIMDNWIEDYALGGSQGATISDMSGSTKESGPNYRRRNEFTKFFTTVTSIEKVLVDQKNFMGNLTMQDEAGYTRIVKEHSWMMWEGGASQNEYQGVSAVAQDPDRANWDGEHVADLMGNGYSGLDSNGFSNPADIEVALHRLSQVIGRPVNGKGTSPFIHMGNAIYKDVQEYKNFEPVFLQGANAQGVTTGNIITGFANPYAGEVGEVSATRIQFDQFMPDHQIEWDIAPELRNEPEADSSVPKPTVTAAAANDTESRFSTGWDGTYEYFVVPAGKDVSEQFYYGTAAGLSAAQAVAVGQKVTLTITRASGGKEDIYLIFRGERNGAGGLAGARLMDRVPATGGVTVYVDKNRKLPGASKAYIVDITNPQVMEYRYLFDPYRLELPINQKRIFQIPMAIADSRYLRFKKSRHIGVIVNYISAENGFRPRGQ